MTRVEAILKRHLQCYRCLELGHVKATCDSTGDIYATGPEAPVTEPRPALPPCPGTRFVSRSVLGKLKERAGFGSLLRTGGRAIELPQDEEGVTSVIDDRGEVMDMDLVK